MELELRYTLTIIAIMISLFSLWLTLRNSLRGKRNEELLRAPNYTVDSMLFIPKKYTFPEGLYGKPEDEKFLFFKRNIIKLGECENCSTFERAFCLVMNICTTPKAENEIKELNCFNKITLRNHGFDAHYLELNSIVFKRNGLEDLPLKPSGGYSNFINYSISKESPLVFFLSLILPKDSGFFDADALEEESNVTTEKLRLTGGELLNARFENRPDKWEEIIVCIISRNKYYDLNFPSRILQTKP